MAFIGKYHQRLIRNQKKREIKRFFYLKNILRKALDFSIENSIEIQMKKFTTLNQSIEGSELYPAFFFKKMPKNQNKSSDLA